MFEPLNSYGEIYTYKTSFTKTAELNQALSQESQVLWEERLRGFHEGIPTISKMEGINLIIRSLQTSVISPLKDFFNKTNSTYSWFNDISFIKILPDTSYEQNFTGEAVQNTITMIYFVNDNYDGGYLRFINKDLNIRLESGSVIIFPSINEYSYKVDGVQAGEMRLGISVVNK